MAESIFNDDDIIEIKKRGTTREEVLKQIETFKKGFSFSKLLRPCTVGDGITSLHDEEIERLNGLFGSGREGVRPFELKAAVQDIIWEGLGPVRSGAGIEAAINALERVRKEQIAGMVIGSPDRTYNRDRMEAIEVPFMIRTGLIVARAALCRQESRGSHYRIDFPERNDEEWFRNVVVKQNKDGDVDIETAETVQTG